MPEISQDQLNHLVNALPVAEYPCGSILVHQGDLQNKEAMNRQFPFLQNIVRSALESNLATGQMDMALFRSSGPKL